MIFYFILKDPFYGLLVELDNYLKHYHQFNKELIDITTNYLNQINLKLNINKINDNENYIYPYSIDNLNYLNDIIKTIENLAYNIFKNLQYYYIDGNSKDLYSFNCLIEEILNINSLLNKSKTSKEDFIKQIEYSLTNGIKNLYRQKFKNLKEKHFNEINIKINSNLVYSMLQFSRDQLNYYTKFIRPIFSKHLNVNKLVLDCIYKLLMDDVKLLCEEHLEELKDSFKLNVNLIALAYRLNQFDNDFKVNNRYEWRVYFLPQLFNWSHAIDNICKKSISNLSIQNDKFKEIRIDEIMNYENDDLNDVPRLISNKIILPQINLSRNETPFYRNNSSTPTKITFNVTNSAFKKFINTESKSPNSSNTEPSLKSHRKLAKTKNRSKSLDSSNRSLSHRKPNKSTSMTNLNRIYLNKPRKISNLSGLKANSIKSIDISELSSLLNISNKTIQYPCSSSLIDLFILIIRFKETIENLEVLIIGNKLNNNEIFLEKKFDIYLMIFSSIFNFLDIYLMNMFALDICGTNEALVLKLFGNEVR